MTDESYDPHARMHESFPRADSGTKMAGDVIPLSSARKEEYPGQAGVINSTGDISQMLNESPWRKASDRTNVIPIKRPGQ